MEMPSFGAIQPGNTFYFLPMSVYNLGVGNWADV